MTTCEDLGLYTGSFDGLCYSSQQAATHLDSNNIPVFDVRNPSAPVTQKPILGAPGSFYGVSTPDVSGFNSALTKFLKLNPNYTPPCTTCSNQSSITNALTQVPRTTGSTTSSISSSLSSIGSSLGSLSPLVLIGGVVGLFLLLRR